MVKYIERVAYVRELSSTVVYSQHCRSSSNMMTHRRPKACMRTALILASMMQSAKYGLMSDGFVCLVSMLAKSLPHTFANCLGTKVPHRMGPRVYVLYMYIKWFPLTRL